MRRIGTQLEPETLADIRSRDWALDADGLVRYQCGCSEDRAEGRMRECEFHEGFDYGVEIKKMDVR